MATGIEIIDGNDTSSGRKLIALRAILYLGRQYAEGDALPENDHEMVEAWLAAGSAAYSEGKKPSVPKAEPATATPGLAGKATASEKEGPEGDLVGKLPATQKRKKK